MNIVYPRAIGTFKNQIQKCKDYWHNIETKNSKSGFLDVLLRYPIIEEGKRVVALFGHVKGMVAVYDVEKNIVEFSVETIDQSTLSAFNKEIDKIVDHLAFCQKYKDCAPFALYVLGFLKLESKHKHCYITFVDYQKQSVVSTRCYDVKDSEMLSYGDKYFIYCDKIYYFKKDKYKDL